MAKLFSVHGLNVSGNEQQIEQYIADSTQYDVIKNSLELISHKVAPACENNADFIHAFRLEEQPDGTSKYLIAITGKGDTQKPTLMTYSPKTQEFSKDVSIDMLGCMRNDTYVSLAAERLSKGVNTAVRQFPEACESMAYSMMAQASAEPSIC